MEYRINQSLLRVSQHSHHDVVDVTVTTTADSTDQGASHLGHAQPWQGGYHGEHVALENAYLRTLAKWEQESASQAHVVVKALCATKENFPVEPSALILLNTLGRVLFESKGERVIDLKVVSEDLDAYRRAFHEYTTTMAP